MYICFVTSGDGGFNLHPTYLTITSPMSEVLIPTSSPLVLMVVLPALLLVLAIITGLLCILKFRKIGAKEVKENKFNNNEENNMQQQPLNHSEKYDHDIRVTVNKMDEVLNSTVNDLNKLSNKSQFFNVYNKVHLKYIH